MAQSAHGAGDIRSCSSNLGDNVSPVLRIKIADIALKPIDGGNQFADSIMNLFVIDERCRGRRFGFASASGKNERGAAECREN